MNFLESDLGHLDRGDIVQVTLTRGANVELLDPSNLSKFKRGEKHQYYGGLARSSPVRIPVPRSGRWILVVHMRGLRGSTRASVKVIPRAALEPLAPMGTARSPVQQIADNFASVVGEEGLSTRDYDVFVSHASEDKDVARPLAEALRERGLAVWFDEQELRIGDSLRRKIDQGIARSRFGIVILSAPFFSKGWPQYELDGLVTLAVTGKQVLLPVWHNVDANAVMAYSPSLADRLALRTSDHSISEMADQIAEVIDATDRDSIRSTQRAPQGSGGDSEGGGE